MKKILSIGAGLMLAVSAFATGNEGVNVPQSGVITPGATPNITNSFALPYQTVPLIVIYASATNGTPITNGVITTTNFSFSFPAAGTNDTYAWQSFVGGTKEAFGTNLVATATTNVTFPFTYATPPTVVCSGSLTNVLVSAVTTTNFTETVSGGASSTGVNWISIGTVYNPQTEYQGNFPVNNKVLTP
jgi:hypothetical protein